MKKITTLLTAGLCFITSIAMAMSKDIVILHTNDIHGGVENNVSLSCLSQYKKHLVSSGMQVALVDAGDALQGSFLAEKSKGTMILSLMKQAGYDFMVPGIHDFDYGAKYFLDLTAQMQGEYYCLNFVENNTGKNVLPSSKLMDFSGTKVGFIGFVAPPAMDDLNSKNFIDGLSRKSYIFSGADDIKSLYKDLQKEINFLHRSGAEYVVLVAHIDKHDSEWSADKIAANTKGLTCIITGGTHELLADRYVKSRNGKDVLVVQAGSKMQAVGKITIGKKGKLSNELIYNLGKGDTGLNTALAKEKQRLRTATRQVIGYFSVYLYTKDPGVRIRYVGSHETNMGDFAADAYKYALGADVVLLDSGVLTGELSYGNVTYQSLLEAFPHEYSLCMVEATGQQILDALEMGLRDFPKESDGFMQVSGLSYTIDTGILSKVSVDADGRFRGVNGQYRVKDVLVGGKPLDLQKTYRVGGSSFVLKYHGHGMDMFKDCKVIEEGKKLQAEAAKLYLQNKLKGRITWKYHNPYGDGRIKFR